MRTIEFNLYEFEELSTEAKEKAIEKNRDINIDYDWWDWLYEGTAEAGIKVNSFDICHRYIDITIEDSEYSSEKIIEEYNEKSEISKISSQFLKDKDKLIKKFEEGSDEYYEEIEYLKKQYKREMAEEILSWLIEDYEYLQTDEAIAETLIANEYEFTEDGKIY